MRMFPEKFPTCGECEHACYYPIPWAVRWLDPKCEITKKSIKPDDVACKYFVGGGLRIMKVLVKFKQEYYEPIMNGVKTQTMRIPPKRLDVKFGEKFIALFPNGEELLCRCIDTGYKAFKSINDDDAQREGFNSASELKKVLEDIYTDYPLEPYSRIYFYRFEYLEKKR